MYTCILLAITSKYYIYILPHEMSNTAKQGFSKIFTHDFKLKKGLQKPLKNAVLKHSETHYEKPCGNGSYI